MVTTLSDRSATAKAKPVNRVLPAHSEATEVAGSTARRVSLIGGSATGRLLPYVRSFTLSAIGHRRTLWGVRRPVADRVPDRRTP